MVGAASTGYAGFLKNTFKAAGGIVTDSAETVANVPSRMATGKDVHGNDRLWHRNSNRQTQATPSSTNSRANAVVSGEYEDYND